MKGKLNISLVFESSAGKIFKVFLISFIICNLSSANLLFSQNREHHKKDSTEAYQKDFKSLDSLKPLISDVVITGNKITDDEIILREMQLKKGMPFNSAQCIEDENRINNLGLFVRAEVIPVLQNDNKVLLKVAVQEKWYIYPMPAVGFVDGDVNKLWVGANIRWQNFRGKNENVNLNFGLGYNPFIHASYSIPWIGKDLHLFSTFSLGYSKDKNRSQLALGKENGSRTYGYGFNNINNNFDYYNSVIKLTIGKFFSRNFSVYTDIGFTASQVTNYDVGRTISPDGIDRYLLTGVGFNFDSRNNREFTTKGFQFHWDYQHYGLISSVVDFGRMNFLQSSYFPLNLKNDYAAIFSTKLNSSFAFGSYIPYYDHKFIGYSGDIVRGWYGFGYEGENSFVLNFDLKLPIISVNFLNGKDIPVVKKIKYLNEFSYKYGLYFALFYDVGTVSNNGDGIRDLTFLNGTGFGLNAIFPFGMTGKIEWGFRLGSPTVGQIIVNLGGRF